ncbi:MAG: ATP-binding protein [Kiritimatiellia bacterium]
MEIERKIHLDRLVAAKHDGFVKILTGIRRCGKSFLLFHLFKRHLLASGVPAARIVEVDLERRESAPLRDPIALAAFIRSQIRDAQPWTYVLIDEIQLCHKVLPEGVDLARIHPDDREGAYVTFYDTLSELKALPNVDVYVTGSNSKLLSSDVATQFRGRGHVIHVQPLSFAERLSVAGRSADRQRVFADYLVYGGLPECVLMQNDAERRNYLSGLHETIYLRDIEERNKVRNPAVLEALLDMVMSNIGGLTNPTKLANSMKTEMKADANHVTVRSYLGHLESAFLVEKALQWDVKGRRYMEYPFKLYASDLGLRNARTGFRQTERAHLMENAIFNELRLRGFGVDVGSVAFDTGKDGNKGASRHEIDFVVRRGSETIYIQFSTALYDEDKRRREIAPLLRVGDSFRKIMVVNDPLQLPSFDDSGIAYVGLLDFLLDPDLL